MSIFQKSKIDLKKHYIIHSSRVRLRDLCDLTFMLFFINSSVVTCRPLCCGFVNRQKKYKRWSEILGGCFVEFLDGYFLGMF